MNEKRFTKIKWDGSKVRLEYEIVRKDGDQDEFTLQCADQPAPEFIAALAALGQDVLTICELPESDGSRVKVRSVTLTYTNDIIGACITALKSLKTANAPLVLNTPHLPTEDYAGADGTGPTLPRSTADRIDMLVLEAERYLNGARAQASLLTQIVPSHEESLQPA